MNALSPQSDTAIEGGLAYLPVSFGLKARLALVIGGGEAAAAKLALLRRAGARVRLVAASIEPALARVIAWDPAVTLCSQPLMAHHFDGAVLAIDASGSDAVNRESARLARAAGVPINVVDRPDYCDFILPAILDRSPVVVAISTGGLAPAVARLIRQRLEIAIPAGFCRVAALAARLRCAVSERLRSSDQRCEFWERLFEGPAAELAIAGQMESAEAVAHALIEESARGVQKAATVYLIRAGSDDPDLLTVRAARLIRMADLIVYEPTIGQGILELARRDAAKVELAGGSDPGTRSQRENLALLREYASRRRIAVYLRDGALDISGDAGREAADLSVFELEVQIVPGSPVARADGRSGRGGK